MMADRRDPRMTHPSRRDFLRTACRGTAAFALLGAGGRFAHAADTRQTARRNIVFILSDDHRYGFYDLQTDPHERHNLIDVPSYQDQIATMKEQLFDELEAGGGLDMRVQRPLGERLDQRKNRH